MTDTEQPSPYPPAIIQSVTVGVEADAGLGIGLEYAFSVAFDSRMGAGHPAAILTDMSAGIGLINGWSFGVKMGFWAVPPEDLPGPFFSISTEVDPKILGDVFGATIPPGSRFAISSIGKTWYFNLQTGKFMGLELTIGMGKGFVLTWPSIDLRASIGVTNDLLRGDPPVPFPPRRVFQHVPPPDQTSPPSDDAPPAQSTPADT